MTKICIKCKKEKELQDFNKDKSRLGGYSYICRECDHQKTKKYYLQKIDIILPKHRQYNFEHQETIKFQKRIYRKKNKQKINLYHKNRRLYDINYKLRSICRNRIYSVLKGLNKAEHTTQLIGCTIEELKLYLENNFKQEMNWENYGSKGWHVDHIIPCASFDLTDPEQQKKCFHYTNLQPLWAKDNLQKSDKVLNS